MKTIWISANRLSRSRPRRSLAKTGLESISLAEFTRIAGQWRTGDGRLSFEQPGLGDGVVGIELQGLFVERQGKFRLALAGVDVGQRDVDHGLVGGDGDG